ncbi:transporter substrate-binding domain-containing protein [Roseococcus sp. SDR]|uniref:substrate-binding periplasmic protein n=1 Tax=Roseococcus sp. SDR TaxID=2835532 RepID=UPI001BCEF9E3|nr:transporter substrate-binding domain-containing protein [Roseococcus sp. SDR]MBS7793162.1 transporter substrate-binding domain-containing protein [Roseococcus sp. SDR]MBV1848476.1 transporter substrate-binding domain-containing protein [Roseococcus sp. SDR]
MRRRALIGSPLLLCAPAVRARGVIELVTAEQRPYAMADGPEPGFVLTLSAELFRLVGLQVVFRFLPWAEAEARAASVPGTAIAPLARTPAREGRFLWGVVLFDDPCGFATLQFPPPETLEAARALPRIAVIEGSPQEAFLRREGFGNLVPMPGRAEALAALRTRDVPAWFGGLAPLRADLGRQARLGRPVLAEPAWLALHPHTPDVPLAALREAHLALEADGSLAQVLRPILGDA